MKKLYCIILATVLFSVVTTAIFLCILPELIPADFILDGTISRFGSKYEYLTIPFFSVLIGVISLVAKALKEKAQKIALYIFIALDGLVTAYGFLTLLNIAILELS
jgi:hypothetical protein